MWSKSLVLLLLTALAAAVAQFCPNKGSPFRMSPFGIMEDFVGTFQKGIDELKKCSLEYKNPAEEYHHEEYNETQAFADAEEFDFIIIGSGASASAIANRLTEVPEFKVLVLEAGGAETEFTQVPAVHPYLQNSVYNWGHLTTPQNKSCLGMEHNQCTVGNGKVLGGDTAINDMLFTRGHPRDYDIWSDEGLIGWCWASVTPFFKRMEDAFAADLDRKSHHYGGPVYLENFQYASPLAPHILDAAAEVGYKKIDYNGKEHLGFSYPQVTTKDGIRNSASKMYLEPAHRRPNLEIRTNSQATKILISEHTKEANGVQYLYDGKKLFIAKATKEVIVSAGAINTAQLLLLSGIGPQEDLKHLGIPVVADLQVGRHLKDHIAFLGLNFVVKDSFGRSNSCPDTEPHKGKGDEEGLQLDIRGSVPYHENEHEQYEAIVEYLKNAQGPLTSSGLDVLGFVKTEASKEQTDYPDVQLLFKRDLHNIGHEHLKPYNIRKDIYDAVWQPLEGKQGYTLEIVLLHPKSTGHLTLGSKNPLQHPLIDTSSFCDEDEEDIETMLEGIHSALKLVQCTHFEKLGIKVVHHKIPACKFPENSDDYWRCAIRHLSVSRREISGTAKMGVDSAKGAVVDKDLRVHGIQKLRVADASVIPVSITGSLSGPEYMIGEQAADSLKTYWIPKKLLL